MTHGAPNGSASMKPSDVVLPAIPKPPDVVTPAIPETKEPKKASDDDAGEKPPKLPKKASDADSDADM